MITNADLMKEPLPIEGNPSILRDLAFKIEEALTKTPRGVNLHRPQALIVRKALFDLADRIELELPDADTIQRSP